MTMFSRSKLENWIINLSSDTRMWMGLIFYLLSFGMLKNTRLEGRLLGTTGREVDWYDYIESNLDLIEENHVGVSGSEGIHESWIDEETFVSFWHDGNGWRGGLYKETKDGELDMKVILFYPPPSNYLRTRCQDLSERVLYRCVSEDKDVWKNPLDNSRNSYP